MVFYKTLSSSNTNSGDAYWVSSDGLTSIIIDAVSLSHNPKHTKDIIIEFLEKYEDSFVGMNIENIIKNLNTYLYEYGNASMLAVIGIIQKSVNSCQAAWVGNIRLYDYYNNNKKQLIEPLRQPDTVIGQNKEISIKTLNFTLENNHFYILSTDGVELELTPPPNLDTFHTDSDLYTWVSDAAVEEDWTLIIFPFESLQTHEKSSWPYNPFVGIQEDRDHEKKGLAAIADALFLDKDFYGFKIVGGGYIPKKDSIRMLDGILVSPYGVILLELKDHYGKISLSTVNRGNMKFIDKNGFEHSSASPIAKLNEVLTVFSEQTSLKEALPQLELRRLGAVVFSHAQVNVKIYTDNVVQEMPQKIGSVIISSPAQFPTMIKAYIRSKFGKRPKKISNKLINEISIKLKGDAPSSNSSHHLIKRRYSFEPDAVIKHESTEYYNLFEGYDTRRKKSVWIKEYKLSTLTRQSIEEEAERIGKEADALREFQKCHEVQDFYDLEHIEEYLYIVLEKIEGITLETWVNENHTQTEKLDLLIKMSDIVIEIEDKNIPHRALNNRNFRVLENNDLRLINFELCKIDYLPTLPPNERRALESQFMAKEVSTTVNQMITTAVDIYSFAIIICYVLSNTIAITAQTHKKYVRNENNWKTLAASCSIDYKNFKEIKSAFDPISQKRPSAMKMKEILLKWRNV